MALGIPGENSCHTDRSGIKELSPEPETNIAVKPFSSDELLPVRRCVLKAPYSSQDLRVHRHEPVWRITDSNPNRAFLPSHSFSFCIQKLIYWNDGMV